jgi:Ca-activated chloride channel family protein
MLDLGTPLNSATARPDDEVWLTVRNDIRVDGVTALPRGTPIRGSVTDVKPAIVNGKNQRTEIQIRLEEIPLQEGGSLAISTETLKVKGEKGGGGGGANTAQGALGGAVQGATLGVLIDRSGRGAGIGAAAGAGIAILASMMQSKGPNSDVDLAVGAIFETKLDRPITITNPKLLAKNIPTPAPSPSTPAANASTAVTAVVVSSPDSSTSTESRPEESPSSTIPAFEPVPAEASKSAPPDSTTSEPVAIAPNGNIKTSTLSVDVNLVQVDAVVRDRTGKPMNNLRQDDFRLFEDGVEQRIQFFSRDSLPLAVAVVIDRSGSVAPLMGQVQSAAFQALQLLKAGDQVALFSFANRVELLEELTSDRQRVANRIGHITAGGGTAIVDGVSEALRYLDSVAPDKRRAVILISDNMEGNSHTRVDDAVTFALESEAVVYSVKVGNGNNGIFSSPGIPGLPMPRLPIPGTGGNDPVKVLTKETGGEIFDATSGTSIATALTSAVDRLKLRYTMSYAPAPGASRSTKGRYHRIEVQLVSRFGKPETDYTIHSRSGYYDPQERSKAAASRP